METGLFILISLILTLATGPESSNRSIYIEGYDRLEFSKEEIKASPGETLQITLKTVSDLPPSQMAHNWVLLKKNTSALSFVNKGQDDKNNDYIDPSLENRVINKTEMLAGGEQETITFEAPEETGKYLYLCTFPGHFQAGMKGQLVVE
ncbi:MAG: plastocyanin/azurin family copper-binding protein [Bacteroidota bacterium]